jgi:hypothetical protein
MAFPSNETKLHDFLVTYRKVLTGLCIADLCFLPIKLFYFPAVEPMPQYQTIGYWLNTIAMSGILPILGLVFIRKARKSTQY